MNKKKVTIAVSTLTLLAVVWIGFVTFSPNQENRGMVRFLSLSEIQTVKENERIRLGGLVYPGSILISEKNQLECNFQLKQGEHSIPVLFTGTRPDLFKDDAEVIVEGNYIDGAFVADQLQTKCASRFEGELRNEASYNTELI